MAHNEGSELAMTSLRDQSFDEAFPELPRIPGPSGYDEVGALRDWAMRTSIPCHRCKADIFVPKKMLAWKVRKQIIKGPGHYTHVGMACHRCSDLQQCKIRTCFGCGWAMPDLDGMEALGVHAAMRAAYYHCEQGRLLLLWALACGFVQCDPSSADDMEDQEARAMAAASSSAESLATNIHVPPMASYPPPPHALHYAALASVTSASSAAAAASAVEISINDYYSAVDLAETGWPTHNVSEITPGVGYGGFGTQQRATRLSALFKKKPEDDATELLGREYLCCLAALLPTPSRMDRNFDHRPLRIVETMVQRSPLLPFCAELLRNASVDNVSARLGLYKAVRQFLETLAAHSRTKSLVTEGMRLFRPEEQTLCVSTTATHVEPQTIESSIPMTELTRRFSRYCRVFLQHAKLHPGDFQSEADAEMLKFCASLDPTGDLVTGQTVNAGQIADGDATGLWSEPLVSLPGEPEENTPCVDAANTACDVDREQAPQDTESSPASATQLEIQARYTAWHTENCVVEVSEDMLSKTHHFYDKAAQLAQNQTIPTPGRMKRLINDLSILRTSLPPGIFVRYTASYMDLLKVMITGPVGTPYENGLWEFDLWCDGGYPKNPPRAFFRSTGSGTERCNPNLYKDGTVCLSLLGTWKQGDAWVPDGPYHSTILQVLVSIQAMIFCEEPYYNEPWTARDDRMSANCNVFVRARTMVVAVMPLLKRGRAADYESGGIWGDVVHEHFSTNAVNMVATAESWAVREGKGKEGKYRQGGVVECLPEFVKLLQERKYLPENWSRD